MIGHFFQFSYDFVTVVCLSRDLLELIWFLLNITQVFLYIVVSHSALPFDMSPSHLVLQYFIPPISNCVVAGYNHKKGAFRRASDDSSSVNRV